MKMYKKYDKYAIFANGGKQYQAVEGETVAIEKIKGGAGESVVFGDILFFKHGEGAFEIGQPYIKGEIKASIVKQIKEPKIIAFKFQRRTKTRVKKGHRQQKTVVRIEKIT